MTADLSLLSLPLTSLLCLPFAFLFNANLALSPLLCSPSSHGEARNEIQNSQERGSPRCGRFWRLFLPVESFWTAMGAQHIPHEMPPRQQSSETPIAAHPTSWRGFGMGSIHFCFGFTHSVHHEECIEVSPTRGSFLHPPVLCSWPPLH